MLNGEVACTLQSMKHDFSPERHFAYGEHNGAYANYEGRKSATKSGLQHPCCKYCEEWGLACGAWHWSCCGATHKTQEFCNSAAAVIIREEQQDKLNGDLVRIQEVQDEVDDLKNDPPSHAGTYANYEGRDAIKRGGLQHPCCKYCKEWGLACGAWHWSCCGATHKTSTYCDRQLGGLGTPPRLARSVASK